MSDPFRVRASAWGGLFDCAHRFEGVHLLGMKSVSGLPAVLGTALHHSTAIFDTARMVGDQVSVDDAAGAFVDRLRHPEGEYDYKDSEMTVNEAEQIGLVLHTRYCLDWSPKFTFRAVEMETKPLDIDCGSGVVIRLTGTLDRSRVYAAPGGVGINDLKSGARAVEKGVAKTKGHAPQVGTYELLYEHTTGERPTAPAGIIGLKTGGKPEIATGEIKNARLVMVGDGEHKGLIEYAAEMFRSGLFPPNPSSILCSEKFCPRWNACRFHD